MKINFECDNSARIETELIIQRKHLLYFAREAAADAEDCGNYGVKCFEFEFKTKIQPFGEVLIMLDMRVEVRQTYSGTTSAGGDDPDGYSYDTEITDCRIYSDEFGNSIKLTSGEWNAVTGLKFKRQEL